MKSHAKSVAFLFPLIKKEFNVKNNLLISLRFGFQHLF